MKKRFILAFTVVIATAVLLCCPAFAKDNDSKTTAPVKNWYDGFIFKSPNYSFQLIRAMSSPLSHDAGECIATARRIKDGDDDSWYKQWKKTAGRIYALGRDYEKKGHIISARSAYFRASNYYRTAGFYLHDEKERPKSLKTWKRSKECFLKGVKSMPNVEVIKIPYENTYLPGYFVKSNSKDKKAPTLIIHTGFDGTGEELFLMYADDLVKRGYNVLIFEGPGQGAVIREQNLPYRPDWENVVTPVVDYALTRKEINKERIALMGVSMGGYLAPRAAAFERRLCAVIANGGVYNFSEAAYRQLPKELLDIMDKDPGEFNKDIKEAMKRSATARWFFNNGMWTFHAKSPLELLKKIKAYNLIGLAEKIECPALIVDSEDDEFFKGQPQKLYSKLKCPKTLLVFTRKETAQAHCQMGAARISNEKIFNWLDNVMGN